MKAILLSLIFSVTFLYADKMDQEVIEQNLDYHFDNPKSKAAYNLPECYPNCPAEGPTIEQTENMKENMERSVQSAQCRKACKTASCHARCQ